jgi:hypothetical protein
MVTGQLVALDRALRALEQEVRALKPDAMAGVEAKRCAERLARIEHVCAAAKAMCARRVEQTEVFRQGGHRSAATWLAAASGDSVGSAAELIATAGRIAPGSAVDDAFRKGRLSPAQAREIAEAVHKDPSAELALLEQSEQVSLHELKKQCRSVRSAATAEETKRRTYERIRAGRFHKSWIDADGAYCYRGRTTPDDGARIEAALDAERTRIARAARAAGSTERGEAYAVDALVALARRRAGGEGSGNTTMILRVDALAWMRGTTEPGETVEIDGIGPVPLALVERYLPEAFVKIVVNKGKDIRTVAHAGRIIPAHLASALEARDPACVVPGCTVASNLETHHIVPFSHGGPTSLTNLCRVCAYHHYLITTEGFAVSGKQGAWRWHEPIRGRPPDER